MKTVATALAFLIGMIPITDPSAAQSTRPAPVFDPAIAAIRDSVPVVMLLPSTLPRVLRGRNVYARGSVLEGEYEVDLRHKGLGGMAGFMASFTGSKSVGNNPPDTSYGRHVRLANGSDAFFAPVSCGGSCGPANVWWVQNGVSYSMQLSLRSDMKEREQARVMLATANAMVPVSVTGQQRGKAVRR